MGERNEVKPPGFDFGNSPWQLNATSLAGKTIVHTTSSGTQGIAAATNASEILTGSFVNAGAIVNYIRSRNPSQVSLICMGYACEYPTDEDTLCAEYLHNRLQGLPVFFNKFADIIRMGSGKRFFELSNQEWAPQQDFDLCLNLDRFNFILKVEHDDSGAYLSRLDPPFVKGYHEIKNAK